MGVFHSWEGLFWKAQHLEVMNSNLLQWVYTQLEHSMCQRLWCQSPHDPDECLPGGVTAAADGTECGTDQWCIQGACVSKSTMSHAYTQQCSG